MVGDVLQTLTKPIARDPEHGALSTLWAAVAPDAADYESGSYFTDPKELGKESNKASDPELMQNFWRVSQEVIKQVVGQDALIDWKSQ